MGRCGTCIVRISGLSEDTGFLRNEATTLNRIAPGIDDIRLACQIPVDDALSNAIITIL
jgi:ferredoxin